MRNEQCSDQLGTTAGRGLFPDGCRYCLQKYQPEVFPQKRALDNVKRHSHYCARYYATIHIQNKMLFWLEQGADFKKKMSLLLSNLALRSKLKMK